LSNTPIENYNEDRIKKIKIDKSIGIFDGTISDIYLPSDNDVELITKCIKSDKCSISYSENDNTIIVHDQTNFDIIF